MPQNNIVGQDSEGLLSPFLCGRRIAAAKPYIKGCVLDFGCGGGRLADFCQPDGYLGYDIDPACVRFAVQKHPQYKFSENLPAGQKFDTVVRIGRDRA